MSGIKSLADELREKIKNNDERKPAGVTAQSVEGRAKQKKNRPKVVNPSLEELLETILSYELNGKEKLLIRLDDRTIFLLKQLKIAKSIDMNKLIAFSVQYFLGQHPELIQYIKENIKTIEL
ncbi:hypothetical protein ACQKCH_15180 [Nubsella zeaxanthinifaciens]|uniref:hypothetical protein n=1 Tax=Nubsella zeaxanthinifaciens TaxID=392412 RepID=UPI003CFE8E61